MEENQSVRGWIEDLPKRGRIIFCFDDLTSQFPTLTNEAIRLSVHRLKSKGRVCSIWRKYYVVVPDEYALRGFVPPIEYIDKLMNSLGHKYYVGLLSAAALHGSSHQKPQSFMVVVNSNDIKSKADNNISIRFISKLYINEDLLLRKNASYGEVFVSNPIMTALDMVLYENRVGGLERATEVIDGLADVFMIADSQSELWTSFPIPVVQRFGYILESILGYTELGDALYQKIRNIGIGLRKTYLSSKLKNITTEKFTYDSKWKMIVNTDLELD
jgi:predicted transcriptional regulator of viral defense system